MAIGKKIQRCKKCPYYSEEMEDYDLHPPIFSLRYLQKNYDLEGMSDFKVAFFDQAIKLSQLSWKQLNQAHRHGLGYEKIKKEAIHAPMPDFIKPDVNLIAFRFCGKAPMVGFRDKSTFYILWFDAGFDLYDH